MSEKQENWRVTGHHASFGKFWLWKAKSAFLLQGLKYVTWRTLDNAYFFISSQIGLFSTFLLVILFLQVKLASPKDN